MNIEQIIFDNNGNWYLADRCDGAWLMPENYQTPSGRWVKPDFEGQLVNEGENYGILVVECSRDYYDIATDASGGADGYYTDCGRYWVDADGKFAADAERSMVD